jgi:hypothetical protein
MKSQAVTSLGSAVFALKLSQCTLHGTGVCSASNRKSTGNIKKIMLLGSKVLLVHGADNLTAIYEPIV